MTAPSYDRLLTGERAATRAELARVAGKCSTLAGLAGAAAVFAASEAGHGPAWARVTLATAGMLLTAAVLVLLLGVLRPRLGTTGFCRYAALSATQVERLFGTGHSDDYMGHEGRYPDGTVHAEDIGAADLHILSCLTVRKQLWLGLAVMLIAVGVVLLAGGLLAGVIT